jgi:signal transduction histidine kinase/CheY-like chemotaxis protein
MRTQPGERAPDPRFSDLIDVPVLQKLAEANYAANGMPIGVIDAAGGEVLVGCGWQDICVQFHRANPTSLARCRESDAYIASRLGDGAPCEYTCRNGLRDIGIPIAVDGRHAATLFLGQFFYEGEAPDREFFRRQARTFGYDERAYLAALGRVPIFSRGTVENILAYDVALARFLSELADRALAHARDTHALREADEAKGEFLGVLSHELRNPLGPIRNALHILEGAPAGGEQALRARGVIERQVDHLTRLVDDLLDATRISRGKIELQLSCLDLAELVERTVEDHRSVFAERGLAIEVKAEARVQVHADRTRVAQIVGNLLQNAAKFTPRGGRVTVTISRVADRVRVSVRDTGVGIDPGMLRRLFRPFAQADDTLHRSQGGLGLGLALVKGLVELHGGRVEARSEGRDRGAEVAFELRAADAAIRDAPASARRADVAPRRVLVIEDNADSFETLREILELSGHEVAGARDGAEGLERARAFLPDVVLCDIGLPVMDGYEVARSIRADAALGRTTLVALTGYALPEDQRRAAEAGFDRHLAKPASVGEIERAIAEAPRLAR